MFASEAWNKNPQPPMPSQFVWPVLNGCSLSFDFDLIIAGHTGDIDDPDPLYS